MELDIPVLLRKVRSLAFGVTNESLTWISHKRDIPSFITSTKQLTSATTTDFGTKTITELSWLEVPLEGVTALSEADRVVDVREVLVRLTKEDKRDGILTLFEDPESADFVLPLLSVELLISLICQFMGDQTGNYSFLSLNEL